MHKIKWAIPFVIIIAAGWWYIANRQPSPQNPGPPPVKIASPKKQKLVEWDEYTGRFRATERVEIRSRVSGYLQEIRFKDGQKVVQGDTLFVIDQRPFQIELERAEARFDLATKEYERTKGLRAASTASQQDLERRTQEFLEAKAALEEAKLNVEFSEVKSPITGRVSRHLVDAGNLIQGGGDNATLLTTVVEEDPIHFYFEANEQELLKYKRLDREGKRISSRDKARPVFVKLQDESSFEHKGHMDFVDNEIDQSTGSIQGRAIFENPNDEFIPGLFGRLRIAGSGEYEATIIPDEAIATNQSQKIVYMVNKDNIIEPRPVELGPLYKRKWRIIRSGITTEDKIVWSGLAKIRPGMKVSPQVTEAQ